MTPLEAAVAAMDHPWRWGTHDCCASACAAFALVRGIDPMAGLRGQYATADGAMAMIEARGGWVATAEAVTAAAGLRRVGDVPGAIGLAPGPWGHALVFCIGPGLWVGKTLRGFARVEGVERAWA